MPPLVIANLHLEILPVAKGRPRVGRFGAVYTPAKTRQFEARLRALARDQYKSDPVKGPISLRCRFFLPKPRTAPRLRQYPDVRPDLDNLLKAVMDSLNGILWLDDAQVVDIITGKRYGAPAINISVETLT